MGIHESITTVQRPDQAPTGSSSCILFVELFNVILRDREEVPMSVCPRSTQSVRNPEIPLGPKILNSGNPSNSSIASNPQILKSSYPEISERVCPWLS